MSCTITSGRLEPCSDNVGGVKELWLASYERYPARRIVGFRQMLVTDFPETTFYKVESATMSFSESLNAEGGYGQNINIRLPGQAPEDLELVTTILNTFTRAVVIDWLGKIRIAGIHNGLNAQCSVEVAGDLAGFNGYNLTLEGLEPLAAPFIAEFPGAGFDDGSADIVRGCLLASSSKLASLPELISSCNIIL